MDPTEGERITVNELKARIDKIEFIQKSLFLGDDRRFKALWLSLPLCLVIFGSFQYLNAKINNDAIDKSISDAKEKIKTLESNLNADILKHENRISEFSALDINGNLSVVTLTGIPTNDIYLRAYPTINKIQSSEGSYLYRVNFTSYVAVKSMPGERGYVLASAYKWGGALADKFAINHQGKIDPSHLLNSFGYQNQYNNPSLITEYRSMFTYHFGIDRATCREARKLVAELQQTRNAGWLEVTMLFKKIKQKPETKRYEISIAESVQDCGE